MFIIAAMCAVWSLVFFIITGYNTLALRDQPHNSRENEEWNRPSDSQK